MSDNASVAGFLAHDDGDVVAVAIRDLVPGSYTGGYLHGPASIVVDVLDEVPLGHKLALVDIAEGQAITEYGLQVGVATQPISKGSYVHVHNVRSARWQNSIA
ncbi:UxaA family hydrolase [Humibacter soli]